MGKPLDKLIVTQNFGAHSEYYSQFGFAGHEGVDFKTKGLGLTSWWNELNGWQTAKAVEDGVCFAQYGHPYYGTYVDLINNRGTFRYAHLKNVRPPSPDSVIPGKDLVFKVKEGDSIGITGKSGNTSGPHLHFMFKPLNPNFQNGYKGWENVMQFFKPHIEIAFIGLQTPLQDEIISKLGYYTPEVEFRANFYKYDISVPSGTLIGDEAVKIIDKVNPKEKFVFLCYQSNPTSSFEVASFYPKRNTAFATVPLPNPSTIFVHAFLHLIRKWINFNKIKPYIEDVEKYPSSWSNAADFGDSGWDFKSQYHELKHYFNLI